MEGPMFFGTWMALLPPLVAIVLALLTKEVYSSLFIGIIVGGALFAGGNFIGTLNHVFFGEGAGLVPQLSDSYNVGILIFLVFLGIIVALMNKAGGSAAFGRWVGAHVKSRIGVQLMTVLLGCLIFIDDYFNCLTVGSVMRPVTDQKKVSRAKLAYLIDATAAPICIIAPISSWAAAVASYAPDGTNGIVLFIQSIPFNYYAILTIVMMIVITLLKFDFGPMKKHEENAAKGDLFTVGGTEQKNDAILGKGKVIDLILPIVILIVGCVFGMLYSGSFFDGESFIDAFANSDASVGLVLGSFGGVVVTLLFYIIRGVLKFRECMDCIVEGFKAMVPAITILALAWTLKGMTGSLGATEFVQALLSGDTAKGFSIFLPMIIFLVAVGMSFATGTSWGTFGILIPITLGVFPLTSGTPLGIVCVSACMAGAVCGDHCSPISDTTIMSSAGAQCNHMAHVSTQLPYALLVACVSTAAYFISALLQQVIPGAVLPLLIAIALMVAVLLLIYVFVGKKKKA